MNFIHATKRFRHGFELKALEDIFLSFDKLKKKERKGKEKKRYMRND